MTDREIDPNATLRLTPEELDKLTRHRSLEDRVDGLVGEVARVRSLMEATDARDAAHDARIRKLEEARAEIDRAIGRAYAAANESLVSSADLGVRLDTFQTSAMTQFGAWQRGINDRVDALAGDTAELKANDAIQTTTLAAQTETLAAQTKTLDAVGEKTTKLTAWSKHPVWRVAAAAFFGALATAIAPAMIEFLGRAARMPAP